MFPGEKVKKFQFWKASFRKDFPFSNPQFLLDLVYF